MTLITMKMVTDGDNDGENDNVGTQTPRERHDKRFTALSG